MGFIMAAIATVKGFISKEEAAIMGNAAATTASVKAAEVAAGEHHVTVASASAVNKAAALKAAEVKAAPKAVAAHPKPHAAVAEKPHPPAKKK